MSEKLIVFAHPDEAASFLSRVCTLPLERSSSPYRFRGGWVLITGMGGAAAQFTLHQFLSTQPVEEVWNLGFAGTLHQEEVGKIHSIKSVAKYLPSSPPGDSPFREEVFPSFSLCPQGGKQLFSVDLPVHNLAQREALQQCGGDLVDMEGYNIAYTALRLGKTCRLWKIVSDGAAPGGGAQIQKEKSRLSKLLADFLCDFFT